MRIEFNADIQTIRLLLLAINFYMRCMETFVIGFKIGKEAKGNKQLQNVYEQIERQAQRKCMAEENGKYEVIEVTDDLLAGRY